MICDGSRLNFAGSRLNGGGSRLTGGYSTLNFDHSRLNGGRSILKHDGSRLRCEHSRLNCGHSRMKDNLAGLKQAAFSTKTLAVQGFQACNELSSGNWALKRVVCIVEMYSLHHHLHDFRNPSPGKVQKIDTGRPLRSVDRNR